MKASFALFIITLNCSSMLGYEKEDAKTPEDVEKAEQGAKAEAKKVVAGHVFGWSFLEAAKMQPQGGNTTGSDVTLFEGEKEQWKKLQEKDLSKLEKDRRAILAMTGSYRVSFDFFESLGFVADYKPPRPYFSWGTEMVIVLEDKPEFISLQHLLVMYFKDGKGEETGPHIIKHWRQDWTYEDSELYQFVGNNTWQKAKYDNPKGKWSQAVFQVDDSPRYEVVGSWDHTGGTSSWSSESCWRPLPRREFSVRKDYNVIGGKHEITITPNGWVHTQNNKKLVVGDDPIKIIGHEIGLNRYEEITVPNLEPGHQAYMKEDPYWAKVREKWSDVFAKNDSFSVLKTVDGTKRWVRHFGYAHKVAKEGLTEEGTAHAKDTIDSYLVIPEKAK